MLHLLIFDDDHGCFGPMTDLRACFEVRTGMLTNAGRITNLLGRQPEAYHVPDRIAGLVRNRVDVPVNAPLAPAGNGDWLLVNGRWSRFDPALQPGLGEAIIECETGELVIARLTADDAEHFLANEELRDRVIIQQSDDRLLDRFPWQVLQSSHHTIAEDILNVRLVNTKVLSEPQHGVAVIGDHPVEVHESAKIYPNVVLDAENGPISIHRDAIIRPGAVVIGPASIGAGSTIIDRAVIKANTAIGPVCKIGGEVGATVFQGYANKAHDGHLGDSWVGKWVNFGAGTTNSNLLNTYGEIPMRLTPEGPRHRTGMQYLGTIVGDHAKFAIGTRLMTGTVIGTGAMIAATAPPPTCVPAFAWLTDEGRREYRIDKFINVMKTVMARRNKSPDSTYIEAVQALYKAHVE